MAKYNAKLETGDVSFTPAHSDMRLSFKGATKNVKLETVLRLHGRHHVLEALIRRMVQEVADGDQSAGNHEAWSRDAAQLVAKIARAEDWPPAVAAAWMTLLEFNMVKGLSVLDKDDNVDLDEVCLASPA